MSKILEIKGVYIYFVFWFEVRKILRISNKIDGFSSVFSENNFFIIRSIDEMSYFFFS